MDQEIRANTIEKVVIHPLVLRNIEDVHIRLASPCGKRIVGVLLGNRSGGFVNVANSFTVPLAEKETDPSRWLNCKHLESMLRMFKGINANEYMVGWFSTLPDLQDKDCSLHALFASYAPHPVLVTLGVRQPPKAYYALNEDMIHVPIAIDVPNPNPSDIGTTRNSTLVTPMTPGGANGLVETIELLNTNSKNRVRIQVEGYDTSLSPVEVALSLESIFQPCGVVHDVEVSSHPCDYYSTGRLSIVVLRGKDAAEKALAFNGSDVGGFRISVTLTTRAA